MENCKKILSVLFVAVGIMASFEGSDCFASEQLLVYKFYKEHINDVAHTSTVRIQDLPLGQKRFKQWTEGNDVIINDEFILDKDYMTDVWKRSRSDEDTDYTGEKKEHTLFIKGKLKGKNIDLRIDLDDKPFYNLPQFNLTKFVLSNAQNIEFWMLRKDRLIKRLMQAKKRGEETILVNGKKTDVIRVFYSDFGVREKYHRRILYFRKTDGLFVKKRTSRGLMADLVSEK